MKIVNVFYPYDESSFVKLFPNPDLIWKDYSFVLNQQQIECDFVIIFTKHNFNQYEAFCNPKNTIFIAGEPSSIQKFSPFILNQFGKVISHRAFSFNADFENSLDPIPWFHEKSFSELLSINYVPKRKKISIISSNKTMNDGHKKRIEFAYKAKDYFGDAIDLFGRGICDFDNKWEVTAPYEFSIAIENEVAQNYISEKAFDCTLSLTYPIYYGAPNIKDYLNAVLPINILNTYETFKQIDWLLNNTNFYNDNFDQLIKDKNTYLYFYSPIPTIVNILDKMNVALPKEKIVLKNPLIERVYSRLNKLFSS